MIRNRDAASASNLSLDTLTGPEIASYRDGTWLMPRVTSAELVGEDRMADDGVLMAELSARLLFAGAQLKLEMDGPC